MADTLRRLANTSSFSVLQDKLENWNKDYDVISCDQNLNRCCELIELTAKIQGQLFAILNQTAADGGHYGGVDTLKTRLLPWLGSCFSMARPSVTDDTSLQLIQDSAEKDRKLRELSVFHESDMQKMETELCSTRLQLDSIRAELIDTKSELDETKNKSTTTLLATEDEILQLKADLRLANEQLDVYKRNLEDYERQIRLLREEVNFLTTEDSTSQGRPVIVRSRSPSPLPRSSSPVRCESPTRAQLSCSTRHTRLVSRFGDLYAGERLDAQSLLRHYINDLETVQRIIYQAIVESFQEAKAAYRHFKLRVRKTLSPSHYGAESLEYAAVDYITRNLDLYDVQASIANVIQALSENPRYIFPRAVDFALLSTLIRETCRVAFAMQTLDPPLDLAFACDGELFSERKYRRSFDSEFSAPLVLYHVWPALVEGNATIVKGEVVTRRGLQWGRSQTRSFSPIRSRSLSPCRSLGNRYRRSASPDRFRAGRL